MKVLEKIKLFLKRGKPVAKIAEEKPPEVGEEKSSEAAREKPAKTAEP